MIITILITFTIFLRYYILDLLRTFPPDVNFLKVEGMELSKEAQALGFPIEHKHKLSCLRQELIDAFVESRYMMFIKYAAVQLQQLGLKKQLEPPAIKEEKKEEKKEGEKEKESEMEEDEAKRIVESMTEGITCGEKKEQVEDSTKQIVQKAAQAVGSLKETEFDIRFNPDVFSPGVVHPKDQGQLKKEGQLVQVFLNFWICFFYSTNICQDAADFLITVQIPAFIRDCLDHSTAPMDGQTLADAIHNRGINMRYLGKITEMLAKVPQLDYVHVIGVTELTIRSAKHLFTHYLQGMDMLSLAPSVSHFLNCLLSSCPTPSATVPDQIHKKRSRNKSKKSSKQSPLTPTGNSYHSRFVFATTYISFPDLFKSGTKYFVCPDSVEWASLTPKSLWAQIRQEAKSYFNWNLEQVGHPHPHPYPHHPHP